VDGTERNKALARRWFTEGWNAGRVDIAEEIFAPELVMRGARVGPAGPRRSVTAIRSVFAPLSVRVDLQVAEDELVVTRYTAHGRHTGPYRGLVPTGRWATASGTQIWRVVADRVVEDWNTFDEWELMAQLGGSAAPDAGAVRP
jgi:predicted ester cyclase